MCVSSRLSTYAAIFPRAEPLVAHLPTPSLAGPHRAPAPDRASALARSPNSAARPQCPGGLAPVTAIGDRLGHRHRLAARIEEHVVHHAVAPGVAGASMSLLVVSGYRKAAFHQG